MSLTDQMDRARRTRTAIEGLIADPSLLGPDFQPIRRLSDDGLLGHKATGRGMAGTEVGDTLSLLQGAQSLGLVERLDWAFRCHAFDRALAEGLAGELHLTPEPETFGSACPPRLASSWGRGRRQLDVVAELHEDAFTDEHALRVALEEMRGWGWRFAVADLSALRLGEALEWIRPAYVQLDVHEPTHAGSAAARAWLACAAQAGAQVMAVGVDSVAARAGALVMGASCARGTRIAASGNPL